MSAAKQIDFTQLAQQIKAWGKTLGFQAVRITTCDTGNADTRLQDWLDKQYHGEMAYMAKNRALRKHPDKLLPSTLRIISVRMDHLPQDHQSLAILKNKNKGYVSRYAVGRDYHKLIRKRLTILAKKGDSSRFEFPRPMLNRPGLDFSFSGLKTFAMNTFLNSDKGAQTKADIACAFEDAVIDTLIKKSERALDETGCDQLVIAGGVSANEKLRDRANSFIKKGVTVFFPKPEFCTDNAAMVAYNGFLRLSRGESDTLDIDVKARWSIAD